MLRPKKLLSDCLQYAASQTNDPQQQLDILVRLTAPPADNRVRSIIATGQCANTEMFHNAVWNIVCRGGCQQYPHYSDMTAAILKEQSKYNWWQYNYCGLNEDGRLILADDLSTFDCFLYKGTSNATTICIADLLK